MKKLLSVVVLVAIAVGVINAQCTIDSSHLATQGVYPAPDSLACIIQNVAYDQAIQGRIPQSKDTVFTFPVVGNVNAHIVIDSLRLDSVKGLPTNITAVPYPTILKGGGTGCITFSGNTNDTTGNYMLTGYGKVWTHIIVTNPISVDTPYVYSGNLNNFSPFGSYYLTVVANQSNCTHTVVNGIRNVNNDLTFSMSVYPNPTSGVFEFKLESENSVNGDLVIVDVTGRTVYTQKVNAAGAYRTSINLSGFAKGLYTLQLRTTEGFASKNISVE